MPTYAEVKLRPRVLVVTNDSTVFLEKNRIASAADMFGGRVTEVKNLVERLKSLTNDDGKPVVDVSFGIITTKYGFVPGDYQIMSYDEVMSDAAGYKEADERKKYVEQTSFLTRPFDLTIICVPNDMFGMFLEYDDIADGKLVAITSEKYKEECEKHGWMWLLRKGARVGNDNADRIVERVKTL